MIFALRIEGGEINDVELKNKLWSEELCTRILIVSKRKRFSPETQSIIGPSLLLSFETETLEQGLYILSSLKKKIVSECENSSVEIRATIDGEEVELNGH